MSRSHSARRLAAALAVLAALVAGCGTDAASPSRTASEASGGPAATPAGDAGEAPGGDPAPAAEWVTESERDTLAEQHPQTTWLAGVFLPDGATEPVAVEELETRYIAFAPAEGQLDLVPFVEAAALLHGASPDGVQNPLADVRLQVFAVEFDGTGEVVTVDFGEQVAATRSMSSTEGLLAFNQLVGMLAEHFPEADQATLTVEGQPDPELFGGVDTTRPFAIRQ